jgi:hypothetical protein
MVSDSSLASQKSDETTKFNLLLSLRSVWLLFSRVLGIIQHIDIAVGKNIPIAAWKIHILGIAKK